MESNGELVRAAAGGDQHAWDQLVERFNNLVWAVARSHRLSTSDAADVVQTTWLRLVEHLSRLHDPDRVGAWLATTAKREALRTIRRNSGLVLSDDTALIDPPDTAPAPDARLLKSERNAHLWHSIGQLSARCQALLRMLMADPPPNYEDVAEALDMPIGSIGPTRGRCLQRLRPLIETETTTPNDSSEVMPRDETGDGR